MRRRTFHFALFLTVAVPMTATAQSPPRTIAWEGRTYALYPETLPERPSIPSPMTDDSGHEYVVAVTGEKRYAIIPATLENSPRNGRQLHRNDTDFPFYGTHGVHADIELDRTRSITGRSIARITDLARPGGLSGDGFLAEDEDIISVLKGDNRLVKAMRLTHPELARPLFHIWNMMLTDLDLDRWNMATHSWENITTLFYNGVSIALEAGDTKGGQLSVFEDGLEGGFFINIRRDLTEEEASFLRSRYPGLTEEERGRFIALLTRMQTGEMEPYYIMWYGFYEGHTAWRTDPVAIAFMFGLKRIEELEASFPGELYKVLTTHHTRLDTHD